MNVRLYRTTESGLATLRRRAFRHVHDLSILTQNAERRGSMVSRVTSDVDTISTFMQWGGVLLIVSLGQLIVATVLMALYSWQLTLLVWSCFLPLFLLLRTFQASRHCGVRRRPRADGRVLAAVSNQWWCVRRSRVRDRGPHGGAHRRRRVATQASTRAQTVVAFTFSTGELVAGLTTAA